MLLVRLFGPGQAHYCQRPLAGFPSQLPNLVLCYLLLNRNYQHGREKLAAVFWPDCTREASLKALRNTLWRLRQLLHSVGVPEERYLATDEDRISFKETDHYWLDIEAFEQGVQQTKQQPGTMLSAEQADELEKAVSLYNGDLLESVYQDWCLVERERLRTLYLNALSTLMSYHEAHANYEQGLVHGEALLIKDCMRAWRTPVAGLV